MLNLLYQYLIIFTFATNSTNHSMHSQHLTLDRVIIAATAKVFGMKQISSLYAYSVCMTNNHNGQSHKQSRGQSMKSCIQTSNIKPKIKNIHPVTQNKLGS